jgi:hypothetical protein
MGKTVRRINCISSKYGTGAHVCAFGCPYFLKLGTLARIRTSVLPIQQRAAGLLGLEAVADVDRVRDGAVRNDWADFFSALKEILRRQSGLRSLYGKRHYDQQERRANPRCSSGNARLQEN